jgi:hypothetical protein
MQCKDFESVLASEGFGPLSAEARAHLGGCLRCQDFLADLDSIVAVARTLPAEVTPPDRVWISLRAQLEAEGLIKVPAEISERAAWWENLGAWLRSRSLATATAALALGAAAFFLAPHASKDTAGNKQPAPAISEPAQPSAPPTADNSAPAIAPARKPPRSSGLALSRVKDLAPSPSENASTTLSEAENDMSNMWLAGNGNAQVDASLRDNLRTLNEFIAECEQHLRKNPQDELAREYLNTAYQQKADLLAAMMESGRSEH